MAYHLFQFPVPGSDDLSELNTFLASHRVVAVKEYLMPTAGGGILTFVVQTTQGETKERAASPRKVDYKNVLSTEAFARFSRLREVRKSLAEQEGVPIYTLFTNEQLAEMARGPVTSLADLRRIQGVGTARIEKYGSQLLKVLEAEATPQEEDEKEE